MADDDFGFEEESDRFDPRIDESDRHLSQFELQFEYEHIPWTCESENDYASLKERIFFLIIKGSDVDGVYPMSLGMDMVGMIAAGLGSERMDYLERNNEHFAFGSPRWNERLRFRDDVAHCIERLVIDGSLEWVSTDEGVPGLHVTDHRVARAWYESNRSRMYRVGHQEEGAPFADLHVLYSMPYAAYLRTDAWKRRRERHLRWAGHRCQVCNAPSGEAVLHVHHRTYERRGAESASDLIVLCGDCHKLFHDHGRVK